MPAIMRAVFADQIGFMTGVEFSFADPTGMNCFLFRIEKRGDFFPAGVFVSPPGPFFTYGDTVQSQGIFMAAPHFHGRMIDPAAFLAFQSKQNLIRFDALFSEPLAVQNFGRPFE